jgi:hypothetical protein
MNNSHFNLFNFLKWRTLRTKNETKKRLFEGKKIANNQVKKSKSEWVGTCIIFFYLKYHWKTNIIFTSHDINN